MNKLDKLLVDSKLKILYELNQQYKEQVKASISNKPIINNYQWVTIYPSMNVKLEKLKSIDDIKKTKTKLDMKLLNILTNLINMYKVSGNIIILQQIELVLEEYINNQCDRF